MSTPSYLGAGQPITGNGEGWLARFGSYFGGGNTPAYAGNGQPLPVASGEFLRGPTPAYALAPIEKQAASLDPLPVQASDEPAVMACPIDPEALAAGHIAIVIPRDRRDP